MCSAPLIPLSSALCISPFDQDLYSTLYESHVQHRPFLGFPRNMQKLVTDLRESRQEPQSALVKSLSWNDDEEETNKLVQ